MPWIMLVVAGFLEVAWAYSMKLSEGFTKPAATVLTLVLMVASFGLLSFSMRSLPLGTAYTIWTGIGAIGAFVVGILAFGEQLTLLRVAAGLLIVSGLVLMKISTPS
jgi:quaternary ammonium compound-resistance protein SugE